MPNKKKKFIDRKNAVTFHLVHRSQQDPLVADENAPQRVLMPQKNDKQIQEQQKYGIYYDDDYNYLQHLRDTGTGMEWERVEYKEKAKEDKKLNLPSSVFASNVEEDVGLLNKAAPQSGLRLDLDPELVAAMDEDYDYDDPENELEDNFVELANASGSEDEYEDNAERMEDDEYSGDEEECSSNFGSEERDEVCSLNGPQYSFNEEETKSRFTEYSMSSSVIRRNENLTLLDRRYEHEFITNYRESDIGALDAEEIEGHKEPNEALMEQFRRNLDKFCVREKLDDIKEKIVLREYSDGEEEFEYVEVSEKPKYDVETILDTLPKKVNLPQMIELPPNPKKHIIRVGRNGIPILMDSNRLTKQALAALDEGYTFKNYAPSSIGGESLKSRLTALSIRDKNETKEERRERKKAYKDVRKERRVEKKASKLAFKELSKRSAKMKSSKSNNVEGKTLS